MLEAVCILQFTTDILCFLLPFENCGDWASFFCLMQREHKEADSFLTGSGTFVIGELGKWTEINTCPIAVDVWGS